MIKFLGCFLFACLALFSISTLFFNLPVADKSAVGIDVILLGGIISFEIIFSIIFYRFIIFSYIIFMTYSEVTPMYSLSGLFWSLINLEFLDKYSLVSCDTNFLLESELLIQHVKLCKINNYPPETDFEFDTIRA